MRSASEIFMFHTKAITRLPQSSSYAIVKKEWGIKVAPWCKHCTCCGCWKGTSWDEAILISEEIKSVALTIFKLCLSEGIITVSKEVSKYKEASQSV